MKKSIPLALLIGLILSLGVSCHRNPNQSLLLAELTMDNQPANVLRLLETMEPDQLSAGDKALRCLLITQAQDKVNGFHTTDTIIRSAISYYERHPKSPYLIRAYYYMGRVSQVLRNAPLAQEYYLKTYNAGKARNDTVLLSLVCNQLGMLYTYQYAYGDALFFMKKSIGYLDLLGDSISKSYVLRNIARTYRQTDSLDQAIDYYKQALQYSNNTTRPSILYELGDRFTEKKDYESAYPYLQESLYLADKEDYPFACLAIGRLFVETGKTDSAGYYLLKSLESPLLQTHLGAYSFLSQLARNNRRHEDYMQYQTEYEILRDSVETSIHKQTAVLMQSLYNYQQVQNETHRVEYEKSIAIRNSLMGIIIALLLTGVSVGQYLLIQAKRRKITQEQETVFQRFHNSRGVIETRVQMSENLKIIAQLKSENEKMKKKKEKEPALFEIRLLELENIWIMKKMEEQELLEKDFQSSDLFLTLQSEKTMEKVNQEDMEKLVGIIDKIYPTFRFRLSASFSNLSIEDLYICYLLKAKIKKIHIGNIIHLSRQAINNRCKNMAEELFGNYSSQKIFEQFIESL